MTDQQKHKDAMIVVCDPNRHTRRLATEILSSAGFENVRYAEEGAELLKLVNKFQPRIVITSSRIPNLSGLEFTRRVREGMGEVNRALSIIVMTDTPTQKFLEAAREAGVDEMLVRPFSGAALLARVEAVLARPRRFVESVDYLGPCRRRRMLEDYGGPLRRLTDPLESFEKPLWEAESNRELVRQCVTQLSALAINLAPQDRRALREIYTAVQGAEMLADETRDRAMGDSARSLGRYIVAVGAAGLLDLEVISTHIDAMQSLCHLASDQQAERDRLVEGLVAVVDKRLGQARRNVGGRFS